MASPAARAFEPGRISPGETIAAGSGLALFVFLFLSWFGPASAWELFDVLDLLLAVIGLGAVAIAAAKAAGRDIPGGLSVGTALAVAGLVASSMILTFVLEGTERKIGLWLAFFAALGILYGGWRAMHEAPGTAGPLAGIGGTTPAPTTPMTPTDAPTTPSPPPAPDPVPGSTGPTTPPGIAGEPPASGGTTPPGI